MNKTIKTLVTLLMIGLALVTFSTSVFAADSSIDPTKIGQGIKDPTSTTITDKSGEVLGIIRVIGVIISVGVLMIIGIKYMMGSAQEKAEYKKVFIPYVIGAGLLLAASVFAQAIYDFFANL